MAFTGEHQPTVLTRVPMSRMAMLMVSPICRVRLAGRYVFLGLDF